VVSVILAASGVPNVPAGFPMLCERDLFNAGRIRPPHAELRVQARMLDFNPIHPAVLLSCGNYPWAGDRLEGIAAEFSIKGIAPPPPGAWAYRDDADVSLSDYLEGLAFSILGTPVRRREVVKYVGDKKSAHVSDRRKHESEQAIDRAWSHLSMTIVSSEGEQVQLNLVYLEILALIEAIASSPSISAYIGDLDKWMETQRSSIPTRSRRWASQSPSPRARSSGREWPRSVGPCPRAASSVR